MVGLPARDPLEETRKNLSYWLRQMLPTVRIDAGPATIHSIDPAEMRLV